MEITSNVIGKLEKIRGGSSFSDSLVVITEIIQNSQRAKAKNLHISLEGDTLTFEDDGVGCKKPENILTLDYSEWESTDEGFGIGLWSWLAVPEVEGIEISSHNWVASINTEELFKTGNPKANVEKQDKIKGFKMVIKSPYFMDKYNASKIEERVISDIETQMFKGHFNKKVIEKIDLHANVDSVFKKYFSTNFFTATLGISRYESPTLYYENRKVRKVYNLDCLSGVVEMRKNALVLQEPDRKSYVLDNKAVNFEARLVDAQKELYLDFIKQANDSDLEDFAETIDRFLDVSDYERFILVDEDEFEIKEGKRNLDISSVNKGHSLDRLNQFLNNINSDNQLNFADESLTEESVVEIEELLNAANENEEEKWILDGKSTFTDGETELSQELVDNSDELIIGDRKYKRVNISTYLNLFESEDEEILTKNILSVTGKKKKEKRSLRQVVKSTPRKVWVKASQAEEYKDLIAKAEYYKVKVFIAKNILEERVFVHNKISHITQIDSGIQKTNISKDVFLKTNKERYFIELLQPILRYYSLSLNTFKLGYLKMYIETTLDGVVINREIIENTKDEIKICGVTDRRDIILDRRAMGLQRFNLSEGNIGINEIKALMANLKTIAHELAHLLYNTEDNTKYHFEMEDMIYEEIVNLYLTI